jgi:hypothetical protein
MSICVISLVPLCLQQCGKATAMVGVTATQEVFVALQPTCTDDVVLSKVSLHRPEHTVPKQIPGSTGLRCTSLAVHSAAHDATSPMLAAACGPTVHLLDACANLHVAALPLTCDKGLCRAVAWASEHSLWLSRQCTVQLWDVRSFSGPVSGFEIPSTLDPTHIHTLRPAAAGCSAPLAIGTQLASYLWDTHAGPFSVSQASPGSGPCASVCFADATTIQLVTSFRRYMLPGDCQPPAQHVIAQHDHVDAIVRGFTSVDVATQISCFTLPPACATRAGAPRVLCGADEESGCVRLWPVAGDGNCDSARFVDVPQHACFDRSAVQQVDTMELGPAQWGLLALRSDCTDVCPILSFTCVQA